MPAFGIAGIPVLVNGQFAYSSAINRVLQLAANIYDADYYADHFVTVWSHIPRRISAVCVSTNVL